MSKKKPAPAQPVPSQAGPVLVDGLLPSKDTMSVIRELAEVFRSAGVAKGTQEQTMALILRGLELHVPPGQAVRDLYIDDKDGSMAMRAGLMRAVVERSGVGHIEVPIFTTTQVVVVGVRGARRQEVSWTIERARELGLTQNAAWRKYPAESLFGRATSMLCRLMFEDLLSGCAYVPEELGATHDVAPAPPAATGPASRPGPRSANAPARRPDAAPAPETPGPDAGATPVPPAAAAAPGGAPGANGGRSQPLPTIIERPLTTRFQVEAAGGGTKVIETAGMTRDQRAAILKMTTEPGKEKWWQVLQEVGREYVRGKLHLATLDHLTAEEADELLGLLHEERARRTGKGAVVEPAKQHGMDRLERLLSTPGLMEHTPAVMRAIEGTYGKPADQLTPTELQEALDTLEGLVRDPATLAIMLERLSAPQ